MALPNPNLNWIQNGEPVLGTDDPVTGNGPVNRPSRELLENDVYLDGRIDNILNSLGQPDGIATLDYTGRLDKTQIPHVSPRIPTPIPWDTALGSFIPVIGRQNKVVDGNGVLNGKAWTAYGGANVYGSNEAESGPLLTLFSYATSGEAGAYTDVRIWYRDSDWYIVYEGVQGTGGDFHLKVEYLDTDKSLIAVVDDRVISNFTPEVIRLNPTVIEPGASGAIKYIRIYLYWPAGSLTVDSWRRNRVAVTLDNPDITALRDVSSSVLEMSENGTGVIEKGSNANGRWVRFSDGTQVCYVRKSVPITGGSTGWHVMNNVPLPAAFVDATWRAATSWDSFPVAGAGIGQKVSIEAKTATDFKIAIGFTGSPGSGNQPVEIIAVGNWK